MNPTLLTIFAAVATLFGSANATLPTVERQILRQARERAVNYLKNKRMDSDIGVPKRLVSKGQLVLLLIACLLPISAMAQAPAQCDPSKAQVLQVYNGGPNSKFTRPPPPALGAVSQAPPPQPLPVNLRDTIGVIVDDLPSLIEEQKCRRDSSAIVLFLDGRPVPGSTVYPPSNLREGILHFELRRSDTQVSKSESDRLWTYILGRPSFEPRILPVSVGLSTQHAVPSAASLALTSIPSGGFFVWLVIFSLALGFFLWLTHKSDIIRGSTPIPAVGRRPYSLSKFQAAWWFFIVLAAYLFIAIVTGEWNTSINGTVLGLLGIAGGTAVGSAFIDVSKGTPDTAGHHRDAKAQIEAEIEGLEKSESELGIQAKTLAGVDKANKLSELQRIRERITERKSALVKAEQRSEGLFIDMVSDAHGVSFHRFQLLTLTILFGIIFIHGVWKDLTMPSFNDGLFGLLGLSSLSFLGLKIPEPSVPKVTSNEPGKG
jgi:hypothetical protein